jgi:hypothetical protein
MTFFGRHDRTEKVDCSGVGPDLIGYQGMGTALRLKNVELIP